MKKLIFLSDEKIRLQFEIIQQDLLTLQSSAKQGSFLREGITAVIAGKPNVGKSSLLNRLSGKNTAIVTNIPGTTRDILRDHILIDGMPMHIVDTAGLRVSDDVIEQEGIKRAYAEIENADIVLYVIDVTEEEDIDLETLPACIRERPIIFIHNKIDLTALSPHVANESHIYLSAQSGDGIALLKNQIKTQVGFQNQTEGIFLARRRHLDALARAAHHVKAGLQQLIISQSVELAAEELRLAQSALNEITGEFTADDLLGRIFANFCIGK